MEPEDNHYNQLSLFVNQEVNSRHQAKIFTLPGAEICMYYNFFDENESNEIFATLYQSVKWEQRYISLYGRKVALPRLVSWYGDQGKLYKYSGIEMCPNPWTQLLIQIKNRIEKVCDYTFNSVLLNLYRDGSDSIAWHSDDEKELGQNPLIASVSFGETRLFKLRHKFQKELKLNLQLSHGDLLIMGGTTQSYWQHQISKNYESRQPRINLTFRKILS